MVWYFVHVLATLLWDAMRLSRLSPDEKTLELLLLRQQLLILRRHQKRGPSISSGEKLILLMLLDRRCDVSSAGKAQLEQLILIFKPETLLRWHQALIKKKWTFANAPKTSGRPPIEPDGAVNYANGTGKSMGHRKIQGELKKLGYSISDEVIRKLLRQYHIPTLPERKGTSNRRTFLNHYRATLLACDFFRVETIRLQTLYVFFFIELATRRVHMMDITPIRLTSGSRNRHDTCCGRPRCQPLRISSGTMKADTEPALMRCSHQSGLKWFEPRFKHPGPMFTLSDVSAPSVRSVSIRSSF